MIAYKGFTLIEIMVVITITVLAIGGAVINVYQFNKTQGVEQDAKNFVTEIRKTYEMAIGNVHDPDCSLTDYQILSTNIKNQYLVVGNGCNYSTTMKMENSRFETTSFTITFKIGSGDTLISTNTDNKIRITDGNTTKVITVNNYGDFKITNN